MAHTSRTSSRTRSRAAWLRRLLAPLVLLSALGAAAQAPISFIISTENSPSHFQTRVVQRFADALAAQTQGRMQVEFHHSAQLFRDQDVIRAINLGKVDMAVPGNWQLDRYDPSTSALTLPLLMGRSAAEHHAFRDGAAGRQISARLEQSLDVVVPGRWIDLGFAHVFTTERAIAEAADMHGLRIRIAGGAAIAAQLQAVGAVPTIVPWPDLPGVLQQGRLDGLLSTYETVASARLWEMGVRHATENQAYFAQYIPIISRSYWDSLPPDLRRAIRQAWDAVVDDARDEAARAQQDARHTLQAHGVSVQVLSPTAMQEWRHQASSQQGDLARKLGIPADLLQATVRQFGPAP